MVHTLDHQWKSVASDKLLVLIHCRSLLVLGQCDDGAAHDPRDDSFV